MTKREYVVGFLFSEDKLKVALIKKNRPLWQQNHLNGIGGKIENGEHRDEAIVREFKEETGVIIGIDLWEYRIKLEFSDSIVYFYCAFSDKVFNVKSITDEQVEIIDVEQLKSYTLIPNLYWLIPLCLDENVEFGSVFGE